MKMLAVSLLVCTVMTLSQAAAGKNHMVVKRSIRCPSGWDKYNGRCFRYIPRSMSWAQAEKNCQSMGANLASVHSADEYHHLQKIIVTFTHSYGETWIGGSDAEQESVWLWSDGSPFNYRHCGGFDNYNGRQHCLQMNYGANNCWDDQMCDVYLPSICAKKA
ncbi:hypothetical protein PAMP_016038 [Pampus punctatissimus]